jgi:N-glycosylase/DNA lyase
MLRSPTLFEDVLKVIATTNTTWSQTKGMVARIVDGFGVPLPGDPGRKAFPTPERIADVSIDEFAAKARMGYRDASAHRIATEIAAGRLDLESWQDPGISSPDLYKRLLALPGIGPYAASCLMIYVGRYDRVNVDSWARMMVGKELGRSVDDKEVHAFFEKYGDWKGLVYHFYNWKEAEPEY